MSSKKKSGSVYRGEDVDLADFEPPRRDFVPSREVAKPSVPKPKREKVIPDEETNGSSLSFLSSGSMPYVIIGGVGLVGIGLVWYLNKKQNDDLTKKVTEMSDLVKRFGSVLQSHDQVLAKIGGFQEKIPQKQNPNNQQTESATPRRAQPRRSASDIDDDEDSNYQVSRREKKPQKKVDRPHGHIKAKTSKESDDGHRGSLPTTPKKKDKKDNEGGGSPKSKHERKKPEIKDEQRDESDGDEDAVLVDAEDEISSSDLDKIVDEELKKSKDP